MSVPRMRSVIRFSVGELGREPPDGLLGDVVVARRAVDVALVAGPVARAEALGLLADPQCRLVVRGTGLPGVGCQEVPQRTRHLLDLLVLSQHLVARLDPQLPLALLAPCRPQPLMLVVRDLRPEPFVGLGVDLALLLGCETSEVLCPQLRVLPLRGAGHRRRDAHLDRLADLIAVDAALEVCPALVGAGLPLLEPGLGVRRTLVVHDREDVDLELAAGHLPRRRHGHRDRPGVRPLPRVGRVRGAQEHGVARCPAGDERCHRAIARQSLQGDHTVADGARTHGRRGVAPPAPVVGPRRPVS